MTHEPPSRTPAPPRATTLAEREAAALRDNLLKRKRQQRARMAPSADGTTTPPTEGK